MRNESYIASLKRAARRAFIVNPLIMRVITSVDRVMILRRFGLVILLVVAYLFSLAQYSRYDGVVKIEEPTQELFPFHFDVSGAKAIIVFSEKNDDTTRISYYTKSGGCYKSINFRNNKRASSWQYDLDSSDRKVGFTIDDSLSPSVRQIRTITHYLNLWDEVDSILDVSQTIRNGEVSNYEKRTEYTYNNQGKMIAKKENFLPFKYVEVTYSRSMVTDYRWSTPNSTSYQVNKFAYDASDNLAGDYYYYEYKDGKKRDSISYEISEYEQGYMTSRTNGDYKDREATSSYFRNEKGQIIKLKSVNKSDSFEVDFVYEKDKLITAESIVKNRYTDTRYFFFLPPQFSKYNNHAYSARYEYNKQGDCISEKKYINDEIFVNQRRVILYY